MKTKSSPTHQPGKKALVSRSKRQKLPASRGDAKANPVCDARIAVFTGSFDPITLGHEDVIRRACLLFDRIVVGVGLANGKNPLFTIEQRVELLRAVCRDLPQVEVTTFSGLSVEFARSKKAVAFVRGIRSSSDYVYEVQMASMNRAMAPEIETVFIPTIAEFSHISSTLAKEIALHEGDTKLLVPDVVAQSLEKLMLERRRISSRKELRAAACK